MRSVYIRLGRIMYWLLWPVSWVYLRWSRRARLLLTHKDEILVVDNWLGSGKWNLPGGGLHIGEDPQHGLIREVFEETGVKVPSDNMSLLATEPYHDHGHRYLCHFYAAGISDKPRIRQQRFEINDAAWIKRAEVSGDSCGPDVLRALELLDTHGAL